MRRTLTIGILVSIAGLALLSAPAGYSGAQAPVPAGQGPAVPKAPASGIC